jgi:hypothetical protein
MIMFPIVIAPVHVKVPLFISRSNIADGEQFSRPPANGDSALMFERPFNLRSGWRRVFRQRYSWAASLLTAEQEIRNTRAYGLSQRSRIFWIPSGL